MTDESTIAGLLKKRAELMQETAELRERMAVAANAVEAIDRVLDTFGHTEDLEGRSPRAPPERLNTEPNHGGVWAGGMIEPVQRIISGFDSSLVDALTEAGVSDDDLPRWIEKIRAKTHRRLLDPRMPIQDAIELAAFLAESAKSYYRFFPGANVVGGDIGNYALDLAG